MAADVRHNDIEMWLIKVLRRGQKSKRIQITYILIYKYFFIRVYYVQYKIIFSHFPRPNIIIFFTLFFSLIFSINRENMF